VQHGGPHDGLGHAVGVAVGGGAAVLQVALAVLAHLARDADGGAAVGHARRELVHGARLVQPGEAARVVLAVARVVHHDVPLVLLAQRLNRSLDRPETHTGRGLDGCKHQGDKIHVHTTTLNMHPHNPSFSEAFIFENFLLCEHLILQIVTAQWEKKIITSILSRD
jgi:hypothetical protein